MSSAPLPLTYSDLVLIDDMDPFAAETTSDLQNLIQDCYHVVMQEKGSNPDDETRGFGLMSRLSGTLAEFMASASDLDAELEKDARIDSSSTVIRASGLPDYPYELKITLVVDGSVYGVSMQAGPNGTTVLQ